MARKKIAQFDSPDQSTSAKVYADAEWQEFRVCFYRAGAKLPDADYHTDDKLEAFDNATLYSYPGADIPALMAWREVHKHQWKTELSFAWMRASYPGVSSEHAAGLQRLRNTCGPSWLKQYPARVGNT